MNLEQLKKILDKHFTPPFMPKDMVRTEMTESGTLRVWIGARDIDVDENGVVASSGTDLTYPPSIPTLIDACQEGNDKITTPEIRVWCHPHKVGRSGDDYFKVFASFGEAEAFIKDHMEAEETPLIAFRGREINLYEMG